MERRSYTAREIYNVTLARDGPNELGFEVAKVDTPIGEGIYLIPRGENETDESIAIKALRKFANSEPIFTGKERFVQPYRNMFILS